jgi:hypothetical protein
MQTILIALAVTCTTVLAVPLAVVAIGIRRQERTGSLSVQPPGVTAALTRKLLDLHAGPQANSRARRQTPVEASALHRQRGDTITVATTAARRAQP